MAIADLKNVLKIFGGSDVTDEQKQELYQEVLMMTLARAADADINIQTVEVDRIRDIIKEHTGVECSTGDIRIAARSELYAQATLIKYLASVRSKLDSSHRAGIIDALHDVFKSDSAVSVLEIDFFNSVAEALQATPAEVAGLVAGEVVH